VIQIVDMIDFDRKIVSCKRNLGDRSRQVFARTGGMAADWVKADKMETCTPWTLKAECKYPSADAVDKRARSESAGDALDSWNSERRLAESLKEHRP